MMGMTMNTIIVTPQSSSSSTSPPSVTVKIKVTVTLNLSSSSTSSGILHHSRRCRRWEEGDWGGRRIIIGEEGLTKPSTQRLKTPGRSAEKAEEGMAFQNANGGGTERVPEGVCPSVRDSSVSPDVLLTVWCWISECPLWVGDRQGR